MNQADLLHRFRLDGKTAIVTGVGPGIGAHVARAFASLGANVVANARTIDRVHSVVDEILAEGGSALAVPGDIGLKDDLGNVISVTLDAFGGVDILFHNAASGTGSEPAGSSLDLDEAVWQAAINVNLLAPFRFAQALVPVMRARGGGSIINVLTTAAFTPVTTLPLAAYGSTKAGLAMLTRYLAKECGPDIRANAICPGTVAADNESADTRAGQPAWAPLMAGIPLGRVGVADEVVGAAVFLASPASSYTTGQVIFVDGGRVNTVA
jgi:NAD(P)-dependent dehydrogenase (short-subunit alcohol dehydrogenase family)